MRTQTWSVAAGAINPEFDMLHELSVPMDAAGVRLDVWLEQQLDGCSRSLVARCIAAGRCAVAPGKAKAGFRLRGGEAVAIEVPEVEPLDLVAEDIPLLVLYEDAELVVLNKVPGMVVHPAVGHRRGTLVNALLGRYGRELSGGEPWRPGLIHRLDADTSGVIAVARTASALAYYQQAFQERRVRKRYLALLAGAPRTDHLCCDGALGRHPKDFRKRAVLAAGHAGAKPASTTFVLRHRADGYVVAEARPYTGRTHQIRVHAAYLGHPILADAVYGRSSRWPLNPGGGPAITRQALHAWELVLPRPQGGELRLQAPIPTDLGPWVPPGLEVLCEPG